MSNIAIMQRSPTMNINNSKTKLSQADPLKHLFQTLFEKLPDSARGHVVAVIGELIGTAFFLFFSFAGGEVANLSGKRNPDGTLIQDDVNPSPAQLLYIALAAGFSLAVNAWTFFRISGGLFNPAISFGMALVGAITWARAGLLTIAQIIGAIIASYLVDALFSGGLDVNTTLSPATSVAQGVIIEMLLTTQLAFTIFMLAVEQHDGTFLAPLGIGLSLFIAELVGPYYTGGSLNPARSLAPAIVTRSFPSYHWIYWVGPCAGAALAALFFKLIKALEYETVNGNNNESASLLPRTRDISRQPSSTTRLVSNPYEPASNNQLSNATAVQSLAAANEADRSRMPVCYAD